MRGACDFVIFLVGMVVVGSLADKELIPLEAPSNLTFLSFEDKEAIIEWDPIEPQSVRGTFKGYLVRIWNHALSQVYAIAPEITKTTVHFFPFSKNFITVAVRNDKYVGPRSSAISFDAPQTEPNMPFLFEHYQLGSTSILLQWNKPTQPNGILLGYNIYCSEMRGEMVDEKTTVTYFVNGADNFQAKLTGLKTGMKYWIQIGAVNCAGESERKTIEVELEPHDPEPPSMPTFKFKIDYNVSDADRRGKHKCIKPKQLPPNFKALDEYYVLNGQDRAKLITSETETNEFVHTDCLVNTLIKWIPDIDNNPGEHFYVKYRIKGEPEYTNSTLETEEDYTILENFNACVNYELIVVAVDGEYETDSEKQETPAVVFMHHH